MLMYFGAQIEIQLMSVQRNKQVLWQYYVDVSAYNLAVSFLVSLYTSILWGMLLYVSFGYVIALGCYQYFQGSTYVFYRNWGWTKPGMILRLGVINCFIVPLAGAIYFCVSWLIWKLQT